MPVYYPNPTDHAWSDLVVGGSAGNPLILLLDEENQLENGYFKDPITNWDGGATPDRYEAEWAMRGSYVMRMIYGDYAHQAFSGLGTQNLLVFTGFVRAENTIDDITVRAYVSGSAARVASPTEYFDVEIDLSGSGATWDEWVPFYMVIDTSGWSGSYLHLEFITAASITGYAYIDDLRLYEIDSYAALECPQQLKLTWQRKVDAEYELINGEKKAFIKGWRPVYTMGYDYCSREELIKHIGMSESTFMFLVPQDDDLNGAYVRLVNSFDESYFMNKFIGHTQNIQLEGIWLQRYKNRQYGGDYFTSTFVDT